MIGGAKFSIKELQEALDSSLTLNTNFDESNQKLVKAACKMQFKVVDNSGGGSCQFLAVSQQVEHHHGEVISAATLRLRVVKHLRDNPYTVSISLQLLFVTQSELGVSTA